MKSLNATLMTSLKTESLQIDDQVVSKIKGLTHAPLREFGPDDIYARRCWLTGDKLNSRFGQFRTNDLPMLSALCVDAPVLVGHDMSMMPIGRFFDSKVEQHAGGTFIVPAFYWPRSTEMANRLAAAIDFGLAGEASIRFTFETATCGLCGKDMRSGDCPHYPGEKDEKTGRVAFYYYDGVNYVYEGSIVARGAHPDTKFGLLGALSNASDDVYDELMNKPKVSTGRRVIDMSGHVLNREVR